MEMEEFPLSGKKSQNKSDPENPGSVSYFSLYRYATKWELLIIFFGIIFTCIKTLVFPAFVAIYGEFTTLLVDRTLGIGTSTSTTILQIFGGGQILTNATLEENREAIKNDSIAFGIAVAVFATVSLVSGIFCIDCFNHTAIRQISRIRIEYFQSFIRQDIGWFDVASGNNNFAVRVTEDIEKIRDGIAEKVSHFLSVIVGFVIYMTMAFIYGWKLTLAIVIYVPFVMIASTLIGKVQARLTSEETDSYSAAANVAEEVLSGIRTVFAFGGEKVEVKRYSQRLLKAKSAMHRKGIWSGVSDGMTRFSLYLAMSVAFLYGVKLVLDDRDKVEREYTPAVLLITTFSLINAANLLAAIAPFLESFATACGSAATIFRVINRVSEIDSLSTEGKTLGSIFEGNISFKKINFSYPSRPDVQILHDFDLEIKAGQSVALVGNSGNGKSTCLQLLQRFYDPQDGQVLIDGCDIRSININSLRSNMATVGQEPVLFSTTISENIRYGKPDATDKDVIEVAKNSGAHDFIVKLPKGYDTLVGEKGSQLSGGQRQRIAIARALIQNPKILLLDEATSALDYQSEKHVQETLNKVSKGRTTIVVSHRLSAIRDADRILFIERGHVVEDGTHNGLMASKGRYFEMITAGGMEDENEDKSEPMDDDTIKANGLEQTTREMSPMNDQNTTERAEELERKMEKREDDEVENDSEQPNQNIQYWKVFKRIMSLAKKERKFMIIAAISSVAIGALWPIYIVFFGEAFGALSLENRDEIYAKTFICSMSILALGIGALVLAVTQTYLFTKSSVNLTRRLRSMTFAAMMRQECAWFDHEDHSSGVLSARLTGDASSLQTAIGFPISILTQALSTFVIGLIVSFSISVKLTLICAISLPFSLITVFWEAKHTAKTILAEKQSTEKVTKIGTEAITNIRTVASLRQEKHMIDRYVTEVKKGEKIIEKKLVWRGLVNSTGQSIPLFIYAAGLCYGGFLVANGEIHYKNVIQATENLLVGIIMFSHSLMHIPSITAAFVGAHRLFQILDREPLITSPNVSNKSRIPDKSTNIDFKKIDFRYPTRPGVQILKGFCLNVEEGKTIALVGPSGCGKSTAIQLLQRLYDPERGRIHIGLDEISSDISLPNLRSKLSIVSQEPVLFEKTIAENIAYGDNSRIFSMDEIIAVAKVANVHNFVSQLPLGYETNVGSKSAQLSGGQKQRIAIARALIRNPQILLLDEATSALDLHSEQVVQQALDAAKSGRTCLVIAHRLSTVQNADAICVLRNGAIVEYGTHSELMALDGIYTRLYNAQK